MIPSLSAALAWGLVLLPLLAAALLAAAPARRDPAQQDMAQQDWAQQDWAQQDQAQHEPGGHGPGAPGPARDDPAWHKLVQPDATRPDLAWGNLLASGLGLALCLGLLAAPPDAAGPLRADPLARWLLLPGALLGVTAALFALARPLPTMARPGAAPALFHLLLGAHHLSLLADLPGRGWLGTLLLVLAVPSGAATVLPGAAALPPEAAGTLSWAALRAAAPRGDPGLLNLGWVFLLLGAGTLAGLAPAQGGLPAAEAAAPTALAPLLAGLLPVAGLGLLLRAAAVPAAAPAALPPEPWLAGLGLLSLGLAALTLLRRGDLRHRLSWAGQAQLGLAALCFGLGVPALGLLLLATQALLRGAALFALGEAAGRGGAAGLLRTQPALGWGLALALAGLAGLPPFATFFSDTGLVLAAARASGGWLLPLVLGLLAVGAGLAATLRALHAPPPGAQPAFHGGAAVLLPLWLHLAVAVLLGFAAPTLLADAAAVLR